MTDPSQSINDDNELLEEFRQQWKRETESLADASSSANVAQTRDDATDKSNQGFVEDEVEARSLFMQAAELEKLGKVFEAMSLYRKAVQIVPDIEFRIYETFKKDQSTLKSKNEQKTETQSDDELNANVLNEDPTSDADDDENLDGVDLMERFQIAVDKKGQMFHRLYDNNTISTGLHFSDLPLEIILYIFRWVVSSDLDMRSLEQLSRVSRGFYICAKDPDIWKLACLRVWGINTGELTTSTLYSSWREMFLYRHRVHFNGCYISKATYLRFGENSFQDQFYRPVQMIEYYRYLRFFPDQCVLMMTTADEPSIAVPKLKNKSSRSDVLKGHYRLRDDVVTIILKRNKPSQQQFQKQSRRGSVIDDSNSSNQSFYMEFTIDSTKGTVKKLFNQLKWRHYAIIQGKSQTKTNFELTSSKYPPLIFSRVKSYHSVSEHPLQ